MHKPAERPKRDETADGAAWSDLNFRGRPVRIRKPEDTPNMEPTPSRARRLRELLLSKQVTVLMEAHNGLSARIVEEAGFKGVWASGLSISAAMGVRDNNEASWTQVLEAVEFMSDAVQIPILLDGDTGFGNFNIVRRLVRKL